MKPTLAVYVDGDLRSGPTTQVRVTLFNVANAWRDYPVRAGTAHAELEGSTTSALCWTIAGATSASGGCLLRARGSAA